MKKQRVFGGILAGILCLLSCNSIWVQAAGYWPQEPSVEAPSAIVMEAKSGAVLYEKNSHEQLYPASITKIMTTLLALENSSLKDEVTFSYASVHNIERDSTHISRDVGEIMTMEQCLYGVMLGSANDCAYAVAEFVGGAFDKEKGYEKFVELMNERAAELGCSDTHFSNPHGLPDTQHYTSAYDMALISRAALENETFRSIAAAKKYTIPVTNKHPNEETYMVNHHKMLTSYQGETRFLYDACIGGKTGYTDAAKNTLVTYAEKNGMTLICVVMKEEAEAQYTDTRKLLDYVFENFTAWNVAENESRISADNPNQSGMFQEEGFWLLDRESRIILPKSVAFEEASCQVQEAGDSGGSIATLEYTYAGRMVGEAELSVYDAGVEPYPFQSSGKKGSIFINLKYILVGAAVAVFLAAAGLLMRHFSRNFYVIRHQRQTKKRRRRRFKAIKRGRRSRRRNRW